MPVSLPSILLIWLRTRINGKNNQVWHTQKLIQILSFFSKFTAHIHLLENNLSALHDTTYTPSTVNNILLWFIKHVKVKRLGGGQTNDRFYEYLQHKVYTQQSIIWSHLKYRSTQNPTKCTLIAWYECSWPAQNYVSVNSRKNFFIS